MSVYWVKKWALWTTAAIILCALPLRGAEHPVPLDKGFDFGQCVKCHQKVTAGKFVHTAMSMGCDTCHQIKNIGVVTTVTTTAKGRDLCVTCHTDKDKAQDGGNLHPPVAQNCTTCHSPHSSANKFQLLKERSGGKDENLCLGCHDKGVNVPEKGSRHPALDLGCDTCHVTHKTGAPGKQEFSYHLVKASPALCLDCHDANDKKLGEAHRGQPFATANCTGCHDPHQSDSPKLMQANVHFPFGEKMCDACHQAPKDGKVVLNEDGKFALCYTCHEDKKKVIEESKNQHPAFALIDRCTECHNPHASRYPRMLKMSPVAVCEQCHEERAQEQKSKKFLHQPAFKDGCYLCHQPHGSENPTLLRTAQVNDLCLTCHNAKPRVKESPNEKTLSVFSGAVTLPANYLDSVPRIAISSDGRGHPQADHPIGGVDDPSNPGHKLQCISCHDPHASDFTKRMFRMDASTQVICFKCHATQRKAQK